MSDKYIIENCPCYDHDYEECLNTFRDEYKKCYDCTDCLLKQIVENLRQVVYAGLCGECDGCGYYNGCSDTECGTYQALKSLELLDIQEVE